MVDVWTTENLQEHVNLLKSTVDYKVKTVAFEQLLYQTTLDAASDFSIKQLEIAVWALSRRLRQSDQPGLGLLTLAPESA